jgi:hypothetical protein
MAKGAQTRINDTLAMIQNAPVLTGAIRTQIAALVANAFPRTTAAEQLAYQTLSTGMSVKANVAAGVAKGTAADRETRRAIYLLWKTMGKTLPAPFAVDGRADAAMSMPVAGLAAAFADAMYKAGVVAGPPGALLVFNDLANHPAGFLRQHRIFIHGSTVGRPLFSTAPTGNYQNVVNFDFQYDAENDRFHFISGPFATLGASHAVQAVSVPAVHWTDVPAVGAFPGNFAGVLGCELAGGPTLMVTTQFTGCAFCWTNHGGVLRAAHISPAGDAAKVNYTGLGLALANRLVNQPGLMANANNMQLTVFGNGAGNAVAHGGGNGFYPQRTVPYQAGQMKYSSSHFAVRAAFEQVSPV